MNKFNPGERAFIIESSIFVKEVEIVKVAGGFRVRESRLFYTKAEAHTRK